MRLSSFSYDYWRDSYSLIVLGPSDSNMFSALLKIPSFRLCDLRNRHLMLSLLVTVGVGWSSLIFSLHVTMSVDNCICLETCIHSWWSRRHFLLLADGFSCRLFCDDILVDQSLLETALSPCYGHSLLFVCHSLPSSVSPSVYTEDLTEKSLG